jgi:hypothetical protein
MKWFKHISDSLDDPFIYELLREFGAEGYLVFFGVLEIYSREYKPENGWKLVTIPSYFRQKLLISSSKVKKILLKIHKWEVEYKDEKVIVFIPKFKELMDDWSKRELRSHSVVTPKILTTDKDKEEDKDIRIKKEIRTFVVPTIGEITSYCLERKNAVNPETWLNHYTSNGWMVGKNKMKDWKASVRTWEAKDGRGHDSKRGFGIQAEYKEQRPELSEEQRRANVERARELAGKIGGVPGKI